MSFCTTCGRPRTGTARFCAGCGTWFPGAGDAAGEPAGESVGAETRWDTRVNIPGEPAPSSAPPTQPSALGPPPPTMVDPPTAGSFGSVPPAQGPYPGPPPPDPGAYQGPVPPAQGPYQGPVPPYQAGYGPQPPAPRRGGSGLLIALVAVLVLAVGGGAFALVSRLTGHKTAAQPPAQPTSAGPSSASVSTSPTAPSDSPASGSPSASRTAPAGTTVAVGPGAQGDPAAPQVQALLERYFTAINAHNYAAYSSLLDAQMRQQNPESTFASGYATTHDSAETLTGISDADGGVLAATVSFTSHQSPADSINNSSCTAWTITLYLEPQGSGYLIGAPPTGYQPTHQDCP